MALPIIHNFTPHTVTIKLVNGDIKTLESEGVARAFEDTTYLGQLGGVAYVKKDYGLLTGLPDPKDGHIYIVSQIAADAALETGRDTRDLYIPSEVERDDLGRIVCCGALARYNGDELPS